MEFRNVFFALVIFFCTILTSISEDAKCPFEDCKCEIDQNSLTVLDCSKFIHLDEETFKDFPSLEKISIDHSTITRIKTDTFGRFGNQKPLTWLSLTRTSITEVPRVPVSNALILSSNSIDTIKNDDFSDATLVETLLLDHNPISTVEVDSLKRLTRVQKLSLAHTRLRSIDLSIFPDQHSRQAQFSLSHNRFLKRIEVSDIISVPTDVKFIFSYSSIEILEDSVAQYLQKTTNVKIDLTANEHLRCKHLTWLALYTQCSGKKVTIDSSRCIDRGRQFLEEFFLETVPTYGVCPSTDGASKAGLHLILMAMMTIMRILGFYSFG